MWTSLYYTWFTTVFPQLKLLYSGTGFYTWLCLAKSKWVSAETSSSQSPEDERRYANAVGCRVYGALPTSFIMSPLLLVKYTELLYAKTMEVNADNLFQS